MDDSKIIDLFNERSERAISAVSRKYGRLSLKIAENILKSREDAEECVNDAFLVLWNKIPPENGFSGGIGYKSRFFRSATSCT